MKSDELSVRLVSCAVIQLASFNLLPYFEKVVEV